MGGMDTIRCCSPPPCNSPTRGKSSTCRSGTRPVASGSCASRSDTVPAPGSIAPRRNAGRSHAWFTTRRNARGAIRTSSSTRPTSTRSCRAWPARPMASGRFRCRGRDRAVASALLFEAMVVELAKTQPVADVAAQVGEHDTRL